MPGVRSLQMSRQPLAVLRAELRNHGARVFMISRPRHGALVEKREPRSEVRHSALRGEHRLGPRQPNRLIAPVLELRSGFPWSAVDEFQDFVGERNRAGRLPAVRTLDFQLSRPWRVMKYRFRAGLRVYNVFGSSADRDIQNNITAPDFGTSYNPIERSVGFVFGSAR